MKHLLKSLGNIAIFSLKIINYYYFDVSQFVSIYFEEEKDVTTIGKSTKNQ